MSVKDNVIEEEDEDKADNEAEVVDSQKDVTTQDTRKTSQRPKAKNSNKFNLTMSKNNTKLSVSKAYAPQTKK